MSKCARQKGRSNKDANADCKYRLHVWCHFVSTFLKVEMGRPNATSKMPAQKRPPQQGNPCRGHFFYYEGSEFGTTFIKGCFSETINDCIYAKK